MDQGLIPNSMEPNVKCPACKGKSWTILSLTNRIQCCRCGLCYIIPNLSTASTILIPETIPSPEVISALDIFEGIE